MDEVDQSNRIVFGGLENHRACAVAKNHASGAVGVVDDRGHHVRADHQDALVSARGDELRPRLHGVDESGTGAGEIESPHAVGAKLVLNQAGGRWKEHVGRDRADDDGINVAGSQTALGKRLLGGLDRQIAGGHAFVHDVALADADAGENPVIGGVDHFFEVGVGEKFRRHVGAEGADFDADRIGQ